MDKIERKNSGDEIKNAGESNNRLTEAEWKFLQDAEAEYARGEFLSGKEANRKIRIWLESLNCFHS